MYIPDYKYKTIRYAQRDLLKTIIEYGEDIEETKEICNTFVIIDNPLLYLEDLSELVTHIAKKHMAQMMLEPNPKLEKTLHGRLHNFMMGFENDIGDDFVVSYDQISEVLKRLKENPFTKRAVLTLWSPEDTNDKYAPPWISSQLMIRDNKLIMTNYFRSCDIYNGFPFNCLGIAKLQKEIADKLSVEVGEFILHIGSAHIYKTNIDKIEQYLAKV